MRVAFKEGVIGWGFGLATHVSALDARGSPKIKELRAKHGGNALATQLSLRSISSEARTTKAGRKRL
jgi:hypothetical protein